MSIIGEFLEFDYGSSSDEEYESTDSENERSDGTEESSDSDDESFDSDDESSDSDKECSASDDESFDDGSIIFNDPEPVTDVPVPISRCIKVDDQIMQQYNREKNLVTENKFVPVPSRSIKDDNQKTMQQYDNNEDKLETENKFRSNIRDVVKRLQYNTSPHMIEEITNILTCNIESATKKSLQSFYMEVLLTALYKKVQEQEIPVSLLQETLHACIIRNEDLPHEYRKMMLFFIAKDVASFKSNFKNIRRFLLTMVQLLNQVDDVDIHFADNIIPFLRNIYINIIQDPETIEEITDPEVVTVLVVCLNSTMLDIIDKHAIIDILSILACNSWKISRMFMYKTLMKKVDEFFLPYRSQEEVCVLDYTTLIWAILPEESEEGTDTYDCHDRINREMIKPFGLPMWYFEHPDGFWIPFEPELNLHIENLRTYSNQEEYCYINEGVIHTMNFEKMLDLNVETSERRAIKRKLITPFTSLDLRKTKKTPVAFVSDYFANCAILFLYDKLDNYNCKGLEKIRIWQCIYGLLKSFKPEQKKIFLLGKTPITSPTNTLINGLKRLFYERCYNLRILAVEILFEMRKHYTEKYHKIFEEEGFIAIIKCIAQDRQVPIQFNAEEEQRSSSVYTEEAKLCLRDQARKFLIYFNVPYESILPKVTKETTIEDLENTPLDILFEVLLSITTYNEDPIPGRSKILKYFVNYLTSTKGPIDRRQRIRNFLEVFANIPQTPTNEELKISKNKYELLLAHFADIMMEFVPTRTLWFNKEFEEEEILKIATDTLQKISENFLKICFNSELQFFTCKVAPFTSIQYMESYIAHKMLADGTEFEERLPEDNPFRIEFYINDNLIPSNITFYEAVLRFGTEIPDKNVFEETHGVFNVVKQRCEDQSKPFESISDPLEYHLRERTPSPEIPEDLRMSLQVIDILYALNEYWPTLYTGYKHQHIIKPKKFDFEEVGFHLYELLTDPLNVFTGKIQDFVGSVVKHCPFVFDLETRKYVFRACYMDRLRALMTAYDNTASDGQVHYLNEYPKVEVSREAIVDDVNKALRTTRSFSSWIVTFKDEIGSGGGIENELFTLASRELQKGNLNIWGSSSVSEKGYVQVEEGLYPAVDQKVDEPPTNSNSAFSSLPLDDKFKTIGLLLGKALLCDQMLDLPLALPVFKWLLNREKELTIDDIKHINPSIHKVLNKIKRMVEQRDRVRQDPNLKEDEKTAMMKNMVEDGEIIDSYFLNFMLPGDSSIELIPNGENILVTLENAHVYLEKLEKTFLKDGVRKQMNSLKMGFNSMINLDSLQIFHPEELMVMICGVEDEEYWSVQNMRKYIRIHGFKKKQKEVVYNLFKLWSSMSGKKRRFFLQFITGSSLLPVGGFENLDPPLTILSTKKTDPYAQTCFNMLHLPENINNAKLKKFIDLAITEGLEYFGMG